VEFPPVSPDRRRVSAFRAPDALARRLRRLAVENVGFDRAEDEAPGLFAGCLPLHGDPRALIRVGGDQFPVMMSGARHSRLSSRDSARDAVDQRKPCKGSSCDCVLELSVGV
jgi:hypothetical protein